MTLTGPLILGGRHLIGRTGPRGPSSVGQRGPRFPLRSCLGHHPLPRPNPAYALIHAWSVRARVAAGAGWVGGSLSAAASRVHLGYHWATDALAGYCRRLPVVATAALVTPGSSIGPEHLSPLWPCFSRPSGPESDRLINVSPSSVDPPSACATRPPAAGSWVMASALLLATGVMAAGLRLAKAGGSLP